MVDYRDNTTNTRNAEDEVRFNIVENVGVVAIYNNGWSKEVNIVEWNGREAKFDIRDWGPDHGRMRKGITLRREEAAEVAKILSRYLSLPDEPAAAVGEAVQEYDGGDRL